MREKTKKMASTPPTLDEVFKKLQAIRSVNTDEIDKGIEVLDGVGKILSNLFENPHMDIDGWNNLSICIEAPINAAICNAREGLRTLHIAIRQAWEAYELIAPMRVKPVSIADMKILRKHLAA